MEKTLNISDNLWHGTIKMIITLSPAFLIGSILLSDKIVPFEIIGTAQKVILAASWIMFLISTFFGIITLLKDAEFFIFSASDVGKQMQENISKIASEQNIYETDFYIKFPVQYTNLFFGITAVVTFLLGILNTALFLVNKVYIAGLFLILFFNLTMISFFTYLLVSHIKKRAKINNAKHKKTHNSNHKYKTTAYF